MSGAAVSAGRPRAPSPAAPSASASATAASSRPCVPTASFASDMPSWSSPESVVSSKGISPREHLARAARVDLLDPGADQHRGHRVAGEVRDRAALGHEAVDADDDADAVDQVGAVGLQSAGERRESGAGDSGGTLRGDDHEHQQADLLGDRHRHAHARGDEQRRHGEVDRGAVEVERVAGRDRDAHDGLRDAEVLHLRDEARQRRLATRRCRRSAGTRGRGTSSG